MKHNLRFGLVWAGLAVQSSRNSCLLYNCFEYHLWPDQGACHFSMSSSSVVLASAAGTHGHWADQQNTAK